MTLQTWLLSLRSTNDQKVKLTVTEPKLTVSFRGPSREHSPEPLLDAVTCSSSAHACGLQTGGLDH